MAYVLINIEMETIVSILLTKNRIYLLNSDMSQGPTLL